MSDFRSLSPAARHEVRVRVLQLRAAGHTYADIAAQTGLSRTGVFDICRRVQDLGDAALHDAPRGQRKGVSRALQPAQEAMACALMAHYMPDQLALPFPLWTKSAVTALVVQRFDVRLSVRNTALYLTRWGIKPIKPPVQSPCEDEQFSMTWWLEHRYPAIATQARLEDGEICWAHVSELCTPESAPSMDAKPQDGVLNSLELPVTHRLLLLSTVSNKGQMHWATVVEPLDVAKLLEFLHRRVRAATRKLFLLAEPALDFEAEELVDWLAEQVDAIEVLYLPV